MRILVLAVLCSILCTAALEAQTPAAVTVISGNGQLTCQLCLGASFQYFDPLVVKVTDANGNPVPNAQVVWTVTAGNAYLGQQGGSGVGSITTATDSTGLTSQTIGQTGAEESGPQFGLQSTITAVAGAAAATFYETQAAPALDQQQAYIDILVNYANAPTYTTISGVAGSASPSSNFPISVLTLTGTGVPNVALFLLNLDGSIGPSATVPSAYCQTQTGTGNYTALTNSSGVAACNVAFGPVVGSGTYKIVTGGAVPQTAGNAPNTNFESGTLSLSATQSGSGTETQTITFGSLANQPLGSAPFTVSATASSGLPVSFASTTSAVCTVSGAAVSLVAAGTCTVQATQAGNSTYAAATPVNQSFQVTQTVSSRVGDAAFRNTYGSIELATYASSTLSNSGGVFASDPSAAQDLSGNTFVAARDTYNSVWANVYDPNTSAWSGWQFGGGIIQGVPSIAVDTSGTAWIASRDTWNSYWLVSYTTGNGFGTWTPLLGIFSTDPVVTSCGDGSIYLIGKDNWNSLWSGQYVPTGFGWEFGGWQFGGGIIAGKPAATCGTDNAVYVVAEDSWSSNWMVRVSGNTWGTWYFGGATTSVTPRIAALGQGSEAVVILDSTSVVYSTTYTEGTANGWQPWAEVGGILSDVAPAGIGGELYLAGKSPAGDLWWWQQTGNQWTWIGNNGAAAGALSASPR
jgi:hypothetical protein